jgi:hypothetical protein
MRVRNGVQDCRGEHQNTGGLSPRLLILSKLDRLTYVISPKMPESLWDEAAGVYDDQPAGVLRDLKLAILRFPIAGYGVTT